MADDVEQIQTILRERLASASDPYFASVTLDLLTHLGNAIFECRSKGIFGWSQPVLLDTIRLNWIWRLATEKAVLTPDQDAGVLEVPDFRDDVIGALRWYLRNLREEDTDLSKPLTEQTDLADLELRHSLFTLPIAQAVMHSSRRGSTMLDRLRTRLSGKGLPSIH